MNHNRTKPTDWQLWMCNQARGNDFLHGWGDEAELRTEMLRLTEKERDVWLVSPDGNKHLPDGRSETVEEQKAAKLWSGEVPGDPGAYVFLPRIDWQSLEKFLRDRPNQEGALEMADKIKEALNPSERDKAYIKTAILNTDEDLEVDENAIVSEDPKTKEGAYVMAWLWVSARDAGVAPEEEASS